MDVCCAAQQRKLPTVGYLGISSPGPFAPLLAAFHDGLREAGFVDGQNVRLEYRWAEGREDRLPALAADLAARNVDVITTHGGALVARAAKNAAPATPIVFETGIDPVAAGLVAGMARPGGNLTGVSILTSELNAKRFELLAEMVPQVRTFAILVNPRNASAERVVAQLSRRPRPGDCSCGSCAPRRKTNTSPPSCRPGRRPARCSSPTTRCFSAATGASWLWPRSTRSRRSTNGGNSSKPAG